MSLDDAKKSLQNLQFPFEVKDEEFTVTIPNRRNDVRIREDLIEEVGRLYGYQHIENNMPKLSVKRGVIKVQSVSERVSVNVLERWDLMKLKHIH